MCAMCMILDSRQFKIADIIVNIVLTGNQESWLPVNTMLTMVSAILDCLIEFKLFIN